MFKYNLKHLKGDLFGGVTAGIVALPLALAFGVQTELGAIAGLYGAIALGLCAAIFGGTKTQISGPTGPMTVVSVVIISNALEANTDQNQALAVIFLTFLLSGFFQVVFGLMQVGKYIRYIPYPVVSGFMSGIGVIIIVLQVFPFFGLPSKKSITDVLFSIGEAVSNMNHSSVFLALGTIAVIYLFPYITRVIPSTLVALLGGTIVSTWLGLEVSTIGEIPTGIPELTVSNMMSFEWANFSILLAPALTLAALGTIDSLLTSVVADNMTKKRHNSNKELIGQGIGNMFAALIGGLPGAGATMRTVVNIKSGGKTRLSGVTHSVVLLLVLFGLGKYAEMIPAPVLAGILITVGISIVDYKGLRHLKRVPRADAVVMITVLTVTVFADLLIAVGVGVFMSCIMFVRQMESIAHKETKVTKWKEDVETPWADEKSVEEFVGDEIFIKHLSGPIFFGVAVQLEELARKIPKVKFLVIRMEKVPFIDQTGLYALEEMIFQMRKRNITVMISGLQSQPEKQLRFVKVIPALVPEEKVYPKFIYCANFIKDYVKTHPAIEEKL